MSGTERYLTVSCGHTTVFCKAVAAGCRTSVSSLADESGRLRSDLLFKDAALKSMVQQGWSWLIIPWHVEKQFPELPHLAQQALNASNSVASQCSELETASTIAEFAELGAKPVDWTQAVAAAAASCPPCQKYIHILGKFVKLYGGGQGAPMIKYLDSFAREFGENLRLGEEYLKAVTDTAFQNAQTLFPLVRGALVATNLVSPKVVDGLARLLVKSDVERLKGPAMSAKMSEAEAALQKAWESLQVAVEKGERSQHNAYGIYGRFSVRLVMHITGKSKACPFEKAVYKDIADVVAVLQRELSAGVLVQVDPSTKAEGCLGPASLAEVSDPMWIAQQQGYHIGNLYTSKGHADLWKLIGMNKTEAEFEEMNLGLGIPRRVLVAVAELKQKLSIFRGTPPSRLTGDVSLHQCHKNEALAMEADRCALFSTMVNAASEHSQCEEGLIFTMSPNIVRAGRNFKKGELKLILCTDVVSKVSLGNTSASIPVPRNDTESFYVSAPVINKKSYVGDWDKHNVLMAFWWVGQSAQDDEVNMVLETLLTDEWHIPMLVNSKAIKMYEKLVKYVAPKRAEPMPLPLGHAAPKKPRKT